MKKLIIFLILSSVTTVFADDLIVDKSSHSQYQTENLLRFDPFDSNNIFEDNYFSAKLTNDTIDVSNKGNIEAIRAGDMPYNYTIPILMLVFLGVISIFLAFQLKRADKKQGYGLELPSNAKA